MQLAVRAFMLVPRVLGGWLQTRYFVVHMKFEGYPPTFLVSMVPLGSHLTLDGLGLEPWDRMVGAVQRTR